MKVMFNVRKLKGKDFGISPDLPKEIMEQQKEEDETVQEG